MTTLQALAGASKIPGPRDKVYKDECFFSFDSPKSEHGLYVCLNSFLGFGKNYVEKYAAKTGRQLFLHMKQVKKPPKESEEESGIPEKVSKMAIGVEGGFKTDVKKDEYDDVNELVIIPSFQKFSIDNNDVPLAIQMSAKAVIQAQSAIHQEALEAAAGSWDGEKLEVSKYAENLEQLDNGVKIPPSGWKCELCDLTCNLWLNLTDGSILCGRKFFDGSGGNNHALEAYARTGYPLAVKLGTITPDGKADVFSYKEDNMVEDPYLKQHLAHFGIKIQEMEKTDKSMAELEIDMNQKFGEWATLCESQNKLEPIAGPGYTGLDNLGNTCYMNSVMQVLFTIPSFIEEYVSKSEETFNNASFDNPESNFQLQMTKLGQALWSGDYSKNVEEENGIKPVMFKNLIGRGHAEFSGKGQQDAQHFYLHLLNEITKEDRKLKKNRNAFNCLQMEVEDRFECGLTGKVKYKYRVEDYVPLTIPLEAAINKPEVDEWKKKAAEAEAKGEAKPEVVRPQIPFEACLEALLETSDVPDFYSSAAQKKTFAKKTVRTKNFPDFLLFHLLKFAVDDHWVPYKLDVEVPMPDEIDLSRLQATGQQPGEELLPDDDPTPEVKEAPQPFHPDEAVLYQLVDMGFSRNGCTRALYETKNSGVEAAMNWVMEHMGDANFNDPFVDPNAAKPKKSSVVPDEGNIGMLMDMSFTREQAIKALKMTDNNMERAVDWIFNHPGDMGGDDAADDDTNEASTSNAEAAANDKVNLTNGSPKYKLVAFISHMGTSHMVGHYVCHILKEGKWVIYNDAKVALSQNPPKGLGYLYLYQRMSS